MDILGSTMGLSGLRGLDLGRPIQILLTDRGGRHAPLALVGYVADEPALRASVGAVGATLQVSHGRAVIGDADAVGDASSYALAPPPTRPGQITFAVHVEGLKRSYLPEIVGMSNPIRHFIGNRNYLRIVKFLLLDVEDVAIAADVDAAVATVELSVTGPTGGPLEAFAARQPPARFEDLGRTEAAHAPIAFEGALDWSFFHTYLETTPHLPSHGAFNDPTFLSKNLAFIDQLNGDMAFAYLGGSAFRLDVVADVRDSREAQELLREGVAALVKADPSARFAKMATPSFEVQGIPVDEYTQLGADPGLTPGVTVHYATAGVDSKYLMAIGPDSHEQIQSMIAASRGSSAPVGLGTSLVSAMSAARARGDSGILVIDAGAIGSAAENGAAPDPSDARLVATVGFQAERITFHLALPTAQLRILGGS